MHPFKDPIAPREDKTSKGFKAPTKEGATTGRYMDAGEKHGSGFRNPVGKTSASNSGPIPYESKCFNPDEMSM